jgi:hypothetical protein
MRAALAGCSVARRGRLDESLCWRQLSHLVDDAAVGRDDELLACQLLGGTDQLPGRSDHVRESDHRLGRFGVRQYLRLRMGCKQRFQLGALEFVVHHAGALPDQHVGAGRTLDVAAQVPVRRP